MKKKARILVLILLCGLLVLLGGSLALGLYYQDNFPVNTWINGVYCTGKTIDEVNTELIERTPAADAVILDAAGEEWTLSSQSIGLRPDYREALRAYLKQNSSFFWFYHLNKPTEASVAVQYVCDADGLSESMEELEFVQKEKALPTGCLVLYSEEDGYSFRDGNTLRLDFDRALEYIRDCFLDGELRIDLTQGSCYRQLEDDARDREQRLLWGRLEEFLARDITYDMGAEKLTLTPDILSGFLAADGEQKPVLDPDGALIPDEQRIGQWVDGLAETYDTCGTVLEFQATRGDVVNVKYATYGTRLDAEAEKKYLLDVLREDPEEPQVHVPVYLQEGFVRGLDDIGGTYIEVDMTEQHMYYYVDGEIVLDTDVVTGNTGKRMGTPEGINFVYNKQRNRVLRGADYETPVKYWMPVKGAVGIHDADWRRKFGGEIYKSNGSHGCINTPPDVMAQLYDMVEIGTPVIMFY
ncbi:MAG: L,D-transpeptidase/peptidoglycan binding protein [bacterium]|nr:L,D-transpeptidase/peptidoglycan binding protein [bacterium]